MRKKVLEDGKALPEICVDIKKEEVLVDHEDRSDQEAEQKRTAQVSCV